MHNTVRIVTEPKKVPEILQYYSSSKVDVLDQMARLYNSKYSSRHWPLQVFYTILDLAAAISTHVLYKEVPGKNNIRRHFILQLTLEMQKIHFSASSVKNLPY